MTEDKEPLPRPKAPPGGNLFQIQVKRFLSEVASAGQAVLKEAQALHDVDQQNKRTNCKPPKAEVPPRVKIRAPDGERDANGVKLIVPPQLNAKKISEKKSLPSKPLSFLVNTGTVVEIPKEVIGKPAVVIPDNDWELLSMEERASRTSNGSFVACPRAGSVRSITSLDPDNSSPTELSVPFKIQRTNSSSTLDSQDNVVGPSGQGVLGVDYVEHVVLPTDTLQGICIAYKVSATHLRRANHFSGTLHSAPKKLLIPLSKQALKTGFIRVQDTDTKEYKLQYFQAEFRDITATEAKAYLELADWDLKDAVQSAKEDREWETESERGNEYVEEDEGQNPETKEKALKSGQIGIKVVDFQGGIPIFNLKGTGFPSLPKSTKNPGDEINISENDGRKGKVVVHKHPPAIATKSVSPKISTMRLLSMTPLELSSRPFQRVIKSKEL
jgi:LysM repeat protein